MPVTGTISHLAPLKETMKKSFITSTPNQHRGSTEKSEKKLPGSSPGPEYPEKKESGGIRRMKPVINLFEKILFLTLGKITYSVYSYHAIPAWYNSYEFMSDRSEQYLA
jgi:hypothetical protein